jgi:caa(3)-type oxidase subunit IV
MAQNTEAHGTEAGHTAGSTGADHAHEQHPTSHYVKIYLWLLALFAISVAGPTLEIQVVTLITAFGVAVLKARLVIRHFMHLSFELPVARWFLTASVVLVALFWAGVAPDVQNHEGLNWENVAAKAAVERGIHEPELHVEEQLIAGEIAEGAMGAASMTPVNIPGPLPGGYNFTHLVFWGVVALVALGTNAVAIILSAGAGLLVMETVKGDKSDA